LSRSCLLQLVALGEYPDRSQQYHADTEPAQPAEWNLRNRSTGGWLLSRMLLLGLDVHAEQF
jgi:hypothetical protein